MRLTDAMTNAATERPTHGGRPEPHDGGGEHEHGGIHEHLKAIHAEHGGKHMLASHDGIEHTTHHVNEDGSVEGPHSHENIEALKDHMGKFLDEEEHEGGAGYGGGSHHGGGKSYFE